MSDTPCVDGCGQDAATIERLRAEVKELRRAGPWTAHVEKQRAMKRERDGDCICNTNPETTDGPDECCPWHGRAYADWIERGDVLQERLAKVEALADEWERNIAMWGTKPARTALVTTLHDLRKALGHPRSTPNAPEAPGQPGRGEDAAGGDSEALARVLWGAGNPGTYLQGSYADQAAAILADPGPLLAALHAAGILHHQSRRLQRGGPREFRHATFEPDGRVEGGGGMATEWRPDARP